MYWIRGTSAAASLRAAGINNSVVLSMLHLEVCIRASYTGNNIQLLLSCTLGFGFFMDAGEGS